MPSKKHLIVVGGATASGKTGLSISLARHFQVPILSADSRQFYRELAIGTAKATEEEQALATHYFVDNLSIFDDYSVGDFEREANVLLTKLYEENEEIILAGGSGLYINALCQGLDHFPHVPAEVRSELEALYQAKGLEYIQQLLKEKDPVYAEKVDLNNPHRIIRALSVIQTSGQPFSHFHKKMNASRSFLPIYVQIHWEREQLYERINLRVEQMFEQGLLEEARKVYPNQSLTALQTVGYQELFQFFDGEIDLETAKELIKRNSRRYAKRQLTWMRRDGFWKHFRPGAWEAVLQYIAWVKATGYQLNREKKDQEGKNSRLFFKRDGEAKGAIQMRTFKKYTLAHMEGDCPSDVLGHLIHELPFQTDIFPVFLLIPPSKEPFTVDTGSLLNPKLKELPDKVQQYLEINPGLHCFRMESRE